MITKADAFTNRENLRVGGLQLLVDHNSAARSDVESRFAGQFVIRTDATGYRQLLRDYRSSGPVTLKPPPFYYFVRRSQTVAEPEPFDIELVFSALP